jgi:hypothetical protein
MLSLQIIIHIQINYYEKEFQMGYKLAKWMIAFKNFCVALVCIAIIVTLVTVFDKAQAKRGSLESPEDIKDFLAEELGGDFSTKELAWLQDIQYTARDEKVDYEIQRFSGNDSMGIWTIVEIWIIDGEVQYFYEREEVIDSLLSSL